MLFFCQFTERYLSLKAPDELGNKPINLFYYTWRINTDKY